MKIANRVCRYAPGLLLGGLLITAAYAQDTPPGSAESEAKDQSATVAKTEKAPTADSQKMNGTDREISRHIRRAVMDDKSLSSAAKNVKIISRNGAVTLRGRVKTEEEKAAIQKKAEVIVGAGSVTNMLEVQGNTSADRAKEKKQGKDPHDVSEGGENNQQQKQ